MSENEQMVEGLYRAYCKGGYSALDELLPGLGATVLRLMALLPGRKPRISIEVAVGLLDWMAWQ